MYRLIFETCTSSSGVLSLLVMYIEAVPNRNSPPAILLRESYREDGKVMKRTLCNLSCAPKGAFTLWVQVPPGQWSVGPVAGRRLGWVTGWV